MPNLISEYLDTTVVISRATEVGTTLTLASFAGGCNHSGSNACGIGVGGTSSGWTLLDQNGLARTPQLSEHIGIVTPTPILFVTNSASGDGITTNEVEAHLVTLAGGWVVDPTP